MGRNKKYTDFLVSDPFVREAKHCRGQTREYVTIKCPHCNETIAEVAKDVIKTHKAKECLKHLRGDPTTCPPVQPCSAALAAGVVVTHRHEPTAAAVREQTAVMQVHHAESMAVQTQQLASQRRSEEHLKAMRDALGLSDHSSSDEDASKIAARAKRKVETLQTAAAFDVFDSIAKAGRFSPPRDGEPPIAVGRRLVQCVATAAEDAGKVVGLQSQLAVVNNEVGIERGAPPAERIDAIRALKTSVAKGKQQLKASQDRFHSLARATERKHKGLQRELAAARKAVGDLNVENRAAKDLRSCFKDYPLHPNEARSFLRTVAKTTHPDKHGGVDTVPGKLATGLQSALNAVQKGLPE